MTSLVTRIARYIGVMDNAEVTFMPETEAFRYEVGLEHFVQGHMLREGPGNSIFMCYPGYDREIELPCPRLSLSLLGEKPNLADGEERARAMEYCRSTDEKTEPGWTNKLEQDHHVKHPQPPLLHSPDNLLRA